jgi:hypothetical protein
MRGLLLAVAILPTTVWAQVDTTATLAGKAISAFNGKPLVGVMIAVPAAHKFSVSDSSGAFRLAGLPTGKQKVRIAYEGRETAEYVFGFSGHRTQKLTVVLDVAAVDLAPLVVEAQARDFSRNLAGFYDRKKWYSGFARFYTREDIEHVHVVRLSSLLAREGITVRCVSEGCIPAMWNRGNLCAVAVAIDGMAFMEQDYDNVQIDEVQAVEVYRSSFMAFGLMPQIATFTPGGVVGARACASVLIWTR